MIKLIGGLLLLAAAWKPYIGILAIAFLFGGL